MSASDAEARGSHGPARARTREDGRAGATAPRWGTGGGDWRGRAWSRAARRAPLTFDASGRVEADREDPWLRLSRQLTGWLESSFQIPGTRLRFGWEPVIGLIPGVGDLVGAALASVLIWTARRHGVPGIVQARMAVNVAVDTAIGAVPVLGDAYDFFFRSNRRNLDLLERALAEPDRRGRASDWAYVGTAVAGAALVAAAAGALALALVGTAIAALF